MKKKIHLVLKEIIADDPELRQQALDKLVREYGLESLTSSERLACGIVTCLATDEQVLALANCDDVESISEDREQATLTLG